LEHREPAPPGLERHFSRRPRGASKHGQKNMTQNPKDERWLKVQMIAAIDEDDGSLVRQAS
jgi:hypothetical protein